MLFASPGRYYRRLGAMGDAQSDADAANHPLTVRIIAGDQTAYLEALRSGVPALVQYAADTIAAQTGWQGGVHQDVARGWSANGHEIFWPFIKSLTPAEYQRVYGVAITNEPWWRQQRAVDVANASFVPGIGSIVTVNNDGSTISYAAPELNGKFGNAWSLNFDLAALHDAAQIAGEKAADAGRVQKVETDVVHPVIDEPQIATGKGTTSVPASQADAGPPAGWARGTLGGKDGWWGPDGLFYEGAEPWKDANRHGVSITSVPDVPPVSSAAPADDNLIPARVPTLITDPIGAPPPLISSGDVTLTDGLTPGDGASAAAPPAPGGSILDELRKVPPLAWGALAIGGFLLLRPKGRR